MNDQPAGSGGPGVAPLNLKKFATEPSAGAEVPSPSEGQTMFIRRSATQSVEQTSESAGAEELPFGIPVQDMLGLITYCYVRGGFSSKEIADRLKSEPALRKKFGRHLPDEQGVKLFRRRFAAEIEDLLETSYRAFPAAAPESPAGQNASETEIVHRQAAERLHDAVREDNMRRHLH